METVKLINISTFSMTQKINNLESTLKQKLEEQEIKNNLKINELENKNFELKKNILLLEEEHKNLEYIDISITDINRNTFVY